MRWRLVVLAILLFIGATAFAPAPFPKRQKPAEGEVFSTGRGVAIKLKSERILGGFLIEGCRVDVVVTTRGPDSRSRLMLQKLPVLAVDSTGSDGLMTVVFKLSEEDRIRLVQASTSGEVRLFLRNWCPCCEGSIPIPNIRITEADLDAALVPENP